MYALWIGNPRMTVLLTCFALTFTVQIILNPRGREMSSSLNYCQL